MHTKKTNPLPRFAVNRPVTVITGLLALMVVGYIAFSRIAVEMMPTGFTPPFLGVWVPYPNSNPKEVEQQIAQPVEEQIQTISGVDRIRSWSQDNGCWTFIQFKQETDMSLAYSQLRDRMDRVKPELPDDIERIFVQKWSDDDWEVMWVAIIQKGNLEDPYFLVEQHVQKPLERIDGVAKIEIWGAQEKSIQIAINQNLVKSYKVNLYEVIQQLRNENFAVSSGYVKEGGRKIFVRSVGKFNSLEQIRNLPIRGANLLLKDIAQVKYDVPETEWRNLIDRKPAITFGVYKESMANTVALTEAVNKELIRLQKTDPKLKDFQFEILFNQGKYIMESVDNLKFAGMWGALFAFIILYFFLRRFRMTIIVTLAIPLSILITLTVMYFMNWTLNMITMMGLMISVGMVVDNSIVVLENIYTKRMSGLGEKDASLLGASEVGLAVTMATFTTVVVFLPLILMSEGAGDKFFMARIGLPVIFSLLASLLVALVFIPLMAIKVHSNRRVKESKLIVKQNILYQKLLRWSLTHRIETSVILLLLIFSMFFAQGKIQSTGNLQGNINDFRLIFELPRNLTIDDVDRIMKICEDTLRIKEEDYGIRTIRANYGETWGNIHVFLKEQERRQWYEVLYRNIMKKLGVKLDSFWEREEVIEDVKKRLPTFPGVEIRTTWRREGGEEATFDLMLYGDDVEVLYILSEEIERRLKTIEEITTIEADRELGTDEIQLHLKRDKIQKYGISPQMISGTIQYALRGFPLPKYQTEEKEIDFQIQLREEDRRNFYQLQNYTFFAQNGKEIPLGSVAEFTVQKGSRQILREDGKINLQIRANVFKKDQEKLEEKIYQVMKGFEMPYGYRWSKGASSQRLEESQETQNFAIILAGTFVFLLMGILFESFILPLSVFVAVPFSFFGAYWLLYITNTVMDPLCFIGFIILIGIVVNNAIVLIDLVNRLRLEGKSRFDAIIEAGHQRFRPILMTALTTIGGLIPMAVGGTEMIGISYSPMGITIIGGLLTSTILSLIAVPWGYTLFDDMRNYFIKITALYLNKR